MQVANEGVRFPHQLVNSANCNTQPLQPHWHAQQQSWNEPWLGTTRMEPGMATIKQRPHFPLHFSNAASRLVALSGQ